jgi:hypothetical protein
MIEQSRVKIPIDVQSAISQYNHGEGAASEVISGQRSAFDVRTLDGLPYGRFRMPAILTIDLPNFGVGL